MPRLTPNLNTLRHLFALSRNQCAYPKCQAPLIESDGLFVGQIAHISAASEGGSRFNPEMSDEARRAHANLILICYPHHVRIDTDRTITTSELVNMKKVHEAKTTGMGYIVNEELLLDIQRQHNAHWESLNLINISAIKNNDLIFEIDVSAKFEFLSANAFDSLNRLLWIINELGYEFEKRDKQDPLLKAPKALMTPEQEADYKSFWYSHALDNLMWEERNLGAPNWYNRGRISLLQMEILYLEQVEKFGLDFDDEKRDRLIMLRAQLIDIAKNLCHND